jgi:hypothetical protein
MTEDELRAYAQRTGKVVVTDTKVIAPERVAPPVSKLELRLDQQIYESGIEEPRRNWLPFPHRQFELDRAWPAKKIAVEVQGMSHRIKGKFKADMEKRALCLLAGWRVLEVGGAEIRSGKAIEWLKILLEV